MWIFRTIFPWVISLAAQLFFSCGSGEDRSVTEHGREKVVELKKLNDRWQLYRNGQPFQVKGGAGFTHLHELASIGGNTIRTWDTTELACVLDEAWGNGLAVIVGLEIPGSVYVKTFYNDTAKVGELERSLRQTVRTFRDHPAVLAWCVGNELYFPYRPRYAPFYQAFNRFIKMVHEEDGTHPVTTTIPNFEKKEIVNLQLKTSGIDFISINTYGQLVHLSKELKDFEWCWDGPFLVSEWGVNGGWESDETAWSAPVENTSTKKAQQYGERFRKYMPLKDDRFLGSLVFYWGAKQEFTHTWFGVFHESGRPTEMLEVLYDCWNDTLTGRKSVQLEYMLVDERGARDHLIFAPGSGHEAKLLLKQNNTDTALRYYWEMIREDWWGNFLRKWEKPPLEPGYPVDTTAQSIRFTAPRKEGPYRIYVTVFNHQGFCATANTPFYVAE